VRQFWRRVLGSRCHSTAHPALPASALKDRCRRCVTDSQTREAFASAIAELPIGACALEDRRSLNRLLVDSQGANGPASAANWEEPLPPKKDKDVGVKKRCFRLAALPIG
jgi:hypothetical protein